LNKKLIGLLWITVCSTVLYAQTRDETISLATIMGVSVPVKGVTPARAIIENAQYSGTVTWSPDVLGTFASTTEYTATITLTAKRGYTFQGVAANFFTVEGAASVRNSANSGVVTAVFPETSGAVVSIAAIQGVTPPAAGNIPVTAITETAQYSGTVTWSPEVSETFSATAQYTATITLTAKRGYGFQGVAANFFTVAGAISTRNSANSGVVTAVFPASVTVSIAAITGVTVPVTGKIPVKAIAETAQYSGTVTWSPEVSETFAAATRYTATITLTPKAGYTLQGVKADYFKVARAVSVSNNTDSGIITAEFAPTKEMPVYSEDKKYKTFGVSLGTAFAAPLIIGTIHGTLAPFNGSFFDLGIDAGFGINLDYVDYFSLYPFANFALFTPFARTADGKRGGWYAGAGIGAMFASYQFKTVSRPIWDTTTIAVNLVIGLNIFDMFDISYTIRTNFKSADSKLSVGYVYRVK